MVISFLFLVHLLKVFSGLFQEWSWVSYEEDSLCIYPFDKIPTNIVLSQVAF